MYMVGPCGSAVERQSLASVLSPSCARPVDDGWPLMGKPSAISQPTRPTQPFILSGSINEKWAAIRYSPPHSVEAPSGERLRGKGKHGVLCRLKTVWSMPERFKVVCTMQGAMQVLCFCFFKWWSRCFDFPKHDITQYWLQSDCCSHCLTRTYTHHSLLRWR